MPEIKWTDAQEEAIKAKDKNILVAAAAGSGKTAVLVERVIRKVIDKDNPIDLDSLVIMTFTKAAAAQMRQKIYKAVRAALTADPDNEHLKKQIVKIHTARICTIDSLCLDIVRENFQTIDIDPAFTVADEAEMKMLQEDVLSDLLEEKYTSGDKAFVDLAQYYTEKNDSKLEELILKLFTFAQSHPEPDAWLKNSVEPYEGKGDNKWMDYITESIRESIKDAVFMAERGLGISQLPAGPYTFTEPFEYIINMFKGFIKLDYEDLGAAIKGEIAAWQDKKIPNYSEKTGVDKMLHKQALKIRGDIKKKLDGIVKDFYSKSFEDYKSDMQKCAPIAQAIADLTIEFSDKFRAAKNERKVADFSDVAHYALDVLIRHDEDGNILREDGSICYTETADHMAREISEIIVDEYQDTNQLQEELINALSGERFGRPNVFMVGDVKQSIYGFRMACPELFMEKFDSYNGPDPNGRRIILDCNFRSREEIIDITNFIFRQIMTRVSSGIDYTDGNELRFKADYKEQPGMEPEIIFIDGKASEGRNAEGFEIAGIIEEIVKCGQVWEGEEKGFRKAGYSDIAIITRQTNNPQIEKILGERGIPVEKNSNKGFFDSFEIRLCLDLLSIIDNPYQDIPFAAVLYSPVTGASANDLAKIRIDNKEDQLSLYDACQKQGRFTELITKIQDWQARSVYMPISDFIDFVLEDSGLVNAVLAMPQGQGRKANLDFLKAKAATFSNGSFSGLFNFIRYIRQLRDSDIDFGNAGVESFDAVHMMTIHKSKGLEFPYVILAASGRQFSTRDLSDSIILDRKLGIGIEYRNKETMEKAATLYMHALKNKVKKDNIAEEMRVLYVAMTRAKEKLYITGSNHNTFSTADKWEVFLNDGRAQLSAETLLSANSFMSMIGPALIKHPSISMKLESYLDVEATRVKELVDNSLLRTEMENIINGDPLYTDEEYNELCESLDYRYKYETATQTKGKTTASQLEKHTDASEEPDKDSDDEELNSFKAKKHGSLTGAERGNAYHRVFELIEYNSSEPAAEQIRKMQASGRISEEYARAVDAKVVDAFIASQVGRRMAQAAAAGKLFREQPFVRGYTEKIDGEDEMLLIQGIIDAFFEENGELVLVDYKTDRNRTEQELIETYKPQQDAYAAALTDAYQMPVKEMIIYSTSLGKEINL